MKQNNLKKYFAIIAITIFGFNAFVQENDKNILIKRKDELEKEISLTSKLLDDTKEKKSNSLMELKLLKSKINSRGKLLVELNNEISGIDAEIQEYTRNLQSLKGELEKAKNEYASIIYYTFKNRNTNLNFMYLLASENINQFYARYIYLKQYKEYRFEQIEMINKLKELIENKLIDLNNKKQEKIQRMNEQLTEKALLISDQEEVKNIVRGLMNQEEILIKQIEEKKKLSKKLEKEIEELIRKEATKNKYDLLTPSERITSDEFVANKGKLPWPTEKGVITDHFGEHEHPVIKNLMVRNNGVDITTLPNSKARTIFNGEISKIFSIKGANTTVIVRHGNFYSVYHNLINVNVKVGDYIKTKDYIGEIYSDEKNGQSILHFEVWKELEKQNPEDWLSN